MKSSNGLQKTLQTISIWRWLLFILFFYFSVVLVVIVEKSPEIRDFPGLMPCNRLGNGIATWDVTGCPFQNGSSICSVTSTKPSIVFSDGLHKSVAGFSRSQPFCLPYSGNILGFGKYRQPVMHWFIISLISRISHCFGSSKTWFKASL